MADLIANVYFREEKCEMLTGKGPAPPNHSSHREALIKRRFGSSFRREFNLIKLSMVCLPPWLFVRSRSHGKLRAKVIIGTEQLLERRNNEHSAASHSEKFSH
jgi:hypothetical protein